MAKRYEDGFYEHIIQDAAEHAWTSDVTELINESFKKPFHQVDNVNSPSHYTAGKVEAIDIIEDAIRHAPDPVVGMLQAQVLKYVLRAWHKGKPTEDLQKADWYLKRLVKALSNV